MGVIAFVPNPGGAAVEIVTHGIVDGRVWITPNHLKIAAPKIVPYQRDDDMPSRRR